MNNPAGAVEIAVSVFAGINTELSPTDLPQGLSPDCLNMSFLPGSVFTRPSLERYLSLPDDTQAVYSKSFIKQNGQVVQLVFDAKGRMFADGVQFGHTAAGSRWKSITAYGREYIAVSDGLHGTDVPMQYDGTNLDRVSQDGPGAAPTVSNYALPPVQLTTGTSGTPIAISSATPINPEQTQTGNYSYYGYQPPQYQTYYSSLQIVTSAAHGLAVGQPVTITGNSLYNGTYYVASVDSTLSFEVGFLGQSNAAGMGGNVTTSGAVLVRKNNIVTATTATPHALLGGYRAQISGVPAAIAATVASLVINNDDSPGIATITTAAPHGLTAGSVINLNGVNPVSIGAGINNTVVSNGIETITTNAAHGLNPGAVIRAMVGSGPYNNATISTVPTPTSFTFTTSVAPTTVSGGDVQLLFPVSADAAANQFTVIQAPTATTFQIAIDYPNGTWTSGSISFAWNGTFYVRSVLSPTQFTYSQAGPDASENSPGTVTPQGQIAPGKHSLVCIFETRTGYLTIPSPPVSFTASGSQYAIVQQVPIGPPNVVRRHLALTSTNGAKYFVIPVAPVFGGQVVGTSTVINDNTTTAAILDFSDQSLLAALSIDTRGNNLFSQVVLGPCLGFHAYAGRLFAWGERNKVQQFRNMGFEGGYLQTSPNLPLGWTVSGTGSISSAGDYGQAWACGTGTSLSQPAYQDQYGIPILEPQTQYTFRLWATGTGNAVADFYSPSLGVMASASVGISSGFIEAPFSSKTPVSIPADAVLRISTTGTAVLDEIEVYYTANPYLKFARASYVNNPEAFDDVTGKIGPASDPNEIRAMFERKDILHILTSGPEGSLYESANTPSGEPGDWSIQHVAAKCGAISVWGDAQFEDWQVWASDTGLRIYDGGNVEKMSQEVQPLWDTINPAAKQFTVVANDPYQRRAYVLAATGSATVANATYQLDYRELNTAAALESSGSLRVGLGGKVFTTDLTRKWCPWSITANHCTVMVTPIGPQIAFCGGSGTTLADTSYGAVYTVRDGQLDGVDDDYGLFDSYYTTYFFCSQDEAQQYKLTPHRKLFTNLSIYAAGVGGVFITPLVNRVGNTWTPTSARPLEVEPNFDQKYGLETSGERVAFRVQCTPNTQGQAAFSLSSLVVAMVSHPFSPVR